MEKDKENAYSEYDKMIRKSWTYARLSEEEKKRWDYIFEEVTKNKYKVITGNFNSRWKQLHNIYEAFIIGLGYPNGKFR